MKNTILTLILLITTTVTFSQSVTNIFPTVVNDKIRIDYTITGVKYYQEVTSVSYYVSRDGGNFIGPLKEITGDMTKGLKNGNHIVFWDVLKEMPFTDEEMVFDVRVTVKDKDRGRKIFVTLTGNDITPLGLRIGQLGKTSWYIEARASLSAMDNASYTFSNGEITDYDKPGYYEFTGTNTWQAYSAIVGITQQVSWNTFLYFGAGYAVENRNLEFNEYNYSETTSLGTAWAKDDESSNTGIEIDAGIIFRYKQFLFGGGGTAINFNSFGWTASLGFSF